MFNKYDSDVQFAISSVQKAAQLVRFIQRKTVSAVLTKSDRSPVTVADYASQALIGYLLKMTFPADVLVGEEGSSKLVEQESAPVLKQVVHFLEDWIPEINPEKALTYIDYGTGTPAKRFWTLDPLDGTKGFLRGDQYAVALALLVDHQVQIGILGCPNLSFNDMDIYDGCLAISVRDEGSWIAALENPQIFKKLNVSTVRDVSQARLLRSFESGHTNVGQIEEFSHALKIQKEPLRVDSQAKYVLLAAAKGEIILRMLSPNQPNYREKIWDHAAGSLIIQEAGGMVTDLTGKALDFSAGHILQHNHGILVTNGNLHVQALDVLQQIYV